MVVLVIILNIWRPKKSFSAIISVLLKNHGSSLMPSSRICFRCENSFHPSGAFHELFFYFFSLKAIFSNIIHFSAFSSFSLNLTGASFKYSPISSRSIHSLVSEFLQVSSSFSNSSRRFVHFSSIIFNSYCGSFEIPFPCYHINSFVSFQNSTGGCWRPSSSLRYISICNHFSMRISSMPNLLLVINLNWWRIRIT